jgi:hypothetical protein
VYTKIDDGVHKLGWNNQTLTSKTHWCTNGGVSKNPILSTAKCSVLDATAGTYVCWAPPGASEGHCLERKMLHRKLNM